MPKRLADMCTASQFLAPHPLWCAPCTRSMSGRLRRYPLRLRYRRSLLCREFSNSKDRPSPKLETRPERQRPDVHHATSGVRPPDERKKLPESGSRVFSSRPPDRNLLRRVLRGVPFPEFHFRCGNSPCFLSANSPP